MDVHNALNPLLPTLPNQIGYRQTWGNLHGSSRGLMISQVAQQQRGVVIVVTPDMLSVQRLIDEIQFYAHQNLNLLSFPDWETLPYDIFSPHQDIISERLTALAQLSQLEHGVLVLPITTLMHRLAPVEYVRKHTLLFNCGQRIQLERLRQQFENSGYRCVSEVREHGEFAVRGGLLDIYPMGSRLAYRIDFMDEEIESIRIFDPETQRSQQQIQEIRLLPAREFPLDEAAISVFRTQWRTQFSGDPTRSPLYRDVSAGLSPAGIEYYLPLFFQNTQTLFDYLPQTGRVISVAGVLETAEQFWSEINHRYQQLRHDVERPLLAPSELFLQANQVFEALKHYPHIALSEETASRENFATAPPPNLPIDARAPQPLIALQQFLSNFSGRVLFTAETTGRRETLLDLLQRHDICPQLLDNWQSFLQSTTRLALTVAPLEKGLWLQIDQAVVVICETQLFGERVAQRRLRQKSSTRDSDSIIRNLTELTLGAPVVHEEHGVGRYLGLVTLDRGGIDAEFLHLEYANHDKLYVPVAQLYLVSRFTGTDPEHAPLHRLGSGQWEKAKRKAAQQVQDVAVELLDVQARRALRQGYAFKQDVENYAAFAATFPFEETPDQQAAIDAVLEDMYSKRPMDRLVCGDVGFGKTEVAMRAAFVAAQDGKQVAVLVPTTLLAQQHYQNFQDRFVDWAVKVEQLSRFRSKKQIDSALEEIADGKIDIVIGTHKLLQDNVKFKRLGLVIIDEEHRFGVKQKERFKALRAEVDILTLTATPIPRSLNMALADLRDLSIIATPPSRRLAVQTFVKEWHTPTLAEGLLRELKRGGQVYFLHNDIESIERMANDLEQLVPEARVQIAHGQMRERELEQVMQDFYHRRFNVLVCTTIIETGIDVPNANTIMINRADKFGLAQLYQLRGRVGRSHHRAYAYLIVPPKKSMTPDAVKRLDALSSLDQLGMGFTLATHDLEIRGAGELLGEEQSGHMQEIGYSLYTELLERAVNALKSGKQPELDKPLHRGTEIDLHIPALIPSDYLPDIHTRLIFYKRIANAIDSDSLREIYVEMVDRFGLLPDAVKALLEIAEVRLLSTPLGIRKIDLAVTGGYILFDAKTASINLAALVKLLQAAPQKYKFDGKERLKLECDLAEFSQRCVFLKQLIQQLAA